MGVSIGSRIGAYEITGAIGAGGMGEVYRARDTKLGRDVAVKVLPAAFAQDHERVSRFRREAQVLASLNHPNIAAIYGIEEAEGAVALILELVEGDDLSARIKKGPIPVDEGLAIGRQIAEAFEEAHERGIVHRDLKPANVKVTPDGRVKVLDFGLAKAFTTDGATSGVNPDVSHSPTLTHQGTEAGMILGTAAYMSPEQARGKSVDKRADIWSFGVVLFEMFSGQRLFTGETVTDVLAALLTRDPDWSLLPAGLPAPVRALMARCLERDPKRRLRDIGEARVAFDPTASSAATAGLFESPTSSNVVAKALPERRRSLPGLLIAMSVLVATVALAWLVNKDQTRAPRRPVIVYDIEPEAGATLVLSNHPALDIARDGSRIVYSALKDGTQRLYLRERDSATSRPIPGTEGANSPALSPDGGSVAFFAENRLKVASLDGAPSTVATVNDPRGVTWIDEATLLLSPEPGSPLSTVSVRGGVLTPFSFIKADQGERSHRWPQALPGGGALFTVGAVSGQGSYDGATVDALEGAGGARQTAVRGARMARYVDGRLLFARGASLFMTPFDLRKAAPAGAPGALAYDLAGDTSTGAAHFAVSSEGTLAYVTGGVDETQRTIIWVDRTGALKPIRIPANAYGELTLSPDGSRFAVVVHGNDGPGGDVWVYDLVREALTRFTFEGRVVSPAWSPDGRWIYYTSVAEDGARTQLFRRAVSGDRDPEPIATDGGLFSINEIARDGRWAYIHLRRAATSVDIDRLDLSTGRTEAFASGKALEIGAQTSPDGRFVAWQSDETGRPEVFVRALGGSGRFQVSGEGGEEPRWSANGRELFFREGERLMAVAVEGGPTFRPGTPRAIMSGLYFARADTGMSYSVAGNGERFLMIGPTGGAPAPKRIRVIVNYPAALTAAQRK